VDNPNTWVVVVRYEERLMTPRKAELPETEVLVLAPTGRDAELAIRVLAQTGLKGRPCRSIEELCALAAQGVGALLLADEALNQQARQCVLDLLAQQPPWSDLPLLLLVSSETSAENLLNAFGTRAMVTILERPIHLSTFSSAAQAAVSARRRQYQIRDLLGELKTANRLKDEFLATLSHELRNPLNSIIGNAQILLRNPETRPLALVQKSADTIHRNAQAQARLINDLLDLSRLQTGKLALDRQVLALAPVLADALESVRESARARQLTIETKLPPEPLLVEGDAVRLEQIVWNLLNNALKFTPQGGRIRLGLEREQNEAKLVVEDNGQGIEPGFLPNLFEMFRQQDVGTSKRHGGMGIGLALVRQLTGLHGGRVEAASEGPGRGARFTVWLPLYEKTRRVAQSPKPVAGLQLTGLRILVVDDTTDSVEMMGILLKLEGAQVVTATSGAEALQRAAEAGFDLLISDISMPGMDGYELVQKLRQQNAHRAHTPAIALTGFGRAEDLESARAAGFTAHLTKPVEFDQLIKLVVATTG
jgi:two-component system, chemotaxis family, CheB/CheR fusion protein